MERRPQQFVLVSILFVGFCVIGFIVACSKREDPHDSEAGPDKFLEIRGRSESDVAIVFVHGLFGDAKSSWTNETTKAYWPQLICNDRAFDAADVYAFSYLTSALTSGPFIDEVGENLALRLDDKGLTKKNLVFIAHSMGGLVVRSMLLNNRRIGDQTKMIYFLGTPTDGADLANLAKVFSDNQQIRQLARNGDRWIGRKSLLGLRQSSM